MPDEQESFYGDQDNRPSVAITGGIAAIPGKADNAAQEKGRLADYLNRLMLICPLQHELWEVEVDGSPQESDVLVSHVVVFDYTLSTADNTPTVSIIDLGETPIFWTNVKRQLDRETSKENPWAVGRLIKPGASYKLAAPIAEDLNAAAIALTEFKKTLAISE